MASHPAIPSNKAAKGFTVCPPQLHPKFSCNPPSLDPFTREGRLFSEGVEVKAYTMPYNITFCYIAWYITTLLHNTEQLLHK